MKRGLAAPASGMSVLRRLAGRAAGCLELAQELEGGALVLDQAGRGVAQGAKLPPDLAPHPGEAGSTRLGAPGAHGLSDNCLDLLPMLQWNPSAGGKCCCPTSMITQSYSSQMTRMLR